MEAEIEEIPDDPSDTESTFTDVTCTLSLAGTIQSLANSALEDFNTTFTGKAGGNSSLRLVGVNCNAFAPSLKKKLDEIITAYDENDVPHLLKDPYSSSLPCWLAGRVTGQYENVTPGTELLVASDPCCFKCGDGFSSGSRDTFPYHTCCGTIVHGTCMQSHVDECPICKFVLSITSILCELQNAHLELRTFHELFSDRRYPIIATNLIQVKTEEGLPDIAGGNSSLVEPDNTALIRSKRTAVHNLNMQLKQAYDEAFPSTSSPPNMLVLPPWFTEITQENTKLISMTSLPWNSVKVMVLPAIVDEERREEMSSRGLSFFAPPAPLASQLLAWWRNSSASLFWS